MFKRKGTFDDPQSLYDDEAPVMLGSFKYSDRKEGPPNIFDTRRPPYPTHKEDIKQWSGESPTSLMTPIDNTDEIPETTLGEGVSFKGELAFERLLRIDGSFEGTLVSSGKIIVGPSGSIKADIEMQEAIIEGRVTGNIKVKDKIELRGGAVVEGDITAKTLCIDEGVSLIGFVRVIGDSVVES
ncbi:MAG: polymer-forming cytoskeletal protein [Victivallaceae bacterium]